jgi:hypothetical protein
VKFGASQSSKRGAFARTIFSGRAVSGGSVIAEPIVSVTSGQPIGLLLSLTKAA